MGSTRLYASADFTCALGFYREGSTQDAHSHPTPTISLLLSGSVHEVVSGREIWCNNLAISTKPADIRHSNLYGRNGALILSISVHSPDLWAATSASQKWHWQSLPGGDYRQLVASLTRPDRTDDGLFDLLACCSDAPPTKGLPPRWLRVVEERLCDEPDVSLSVVAGEAQVHPVYLARVFRSWYGRSPSAFRLRQRTSSAIDAALWSGEGAAAIAQHVGFADQSHMARSIRSATGHNLSQLRTLARRCLEARPDLIAS